MLRRCGLATDQKAVDRRGPGRVVLGSKPQLATPKKLVSWAERADCQKLVRWAARPGWYRPANVGSFESLVFLTCSHLCRTVYRYGSRLAGPCCRPAPCRPSRHCLTLGGAEGACCNRTSFER